MDTPADLVGFCRAEWSRLVGALVLLTGDADLAEELAQDTIVRVCRDWRKVSSMDAPGAWAHRVAVNLAHSHFRRRAAARRALAKAMTRDRHDPLEDAASVLAVRACDAQLPLRPLQSIGPGDVFLWVVESNPAQAIRQQRGVAPPPRPKHFSARTATTMDCSSQVFTPGLPASSLSFTDHGRWISAHVVFGPNTSPARKAETWRLLDSLRFDTLRSFSKGRVQLRYPKGWRIARRNLTPALGDPHEVVSLGTFAMKPTNHNCAQVPVNALEAMGPKDAFVSIQANKNGATRGFVPRPSYFGPTAGLDGSKAAGSDLGACINGLPGLFLRWIPFPEQGGGFYAIVAIGPDAPPKRQAEVWQILNSLSVLHLSERAAIAHLDPAPVGPGFWFRRESRKLATTGAARHTIRPRNGPSLRLPM